MAGNQSAFFLGFSLLSHPDILTCLPVTYAFTPFGISQLLLLSQRNIRRKPLNILVIIARKLWYQWNIYGFPIGVKGRGTFRNLILVCYLHYISVCKKHFSPPDNLLWIVSFQSMVLHDFLSFIVNKNIYLNNTLPYPCFTSIYTQLLGRLSDFFLFFSCLH